MAKVRVLKLSLHNRLVGYLASFDNGKNVLTFAQEFIMDDNRPTLSLTTRPDFPYANKRLSEQWVNRQQLNPLLSNLLPEGSLRLLLAQGLKIHQDNEFELLTYLGHDLPGALVAESIEPEAVPSYIFDSANISPSTTFTLPQNYPHFSLAGVQMKLSMKHQSGRFTLPNPNKDSDLGDWIIKTPSLIHPGVAENEYSMMKLAQMVGVDIPDIQLVRLDKLDNLPILNLPNEPYAYAIRRFDRNNTSDDALTQRVHSEDFAQILGKYPHDKYQGGNYQQIAKILYQYSENGLADVKQMARRLFVNILLGNGDAHLKNWSVIYPDGFNLRLSPAYDIVFTKAYIPTETSLALNLGKSKNWYEIRFPEFEYWAKKADIPWRAIKSELKDVLDMGRDTWLVEINNLPMLDSQKELLFEHWRKLGKRGKI